MKAIEFSFSPNGKAIMIHGNDGVRQYCREDKEFTDLYFYNIKSDYPDAYDALAIFFKDSILNFENFKFLAVRQFLACRHGNLDNIPDEDENGNMHSEFVPCAIRPACPMKWAICECRITTKLSQGEFDVLKYHFNGLSEQQIAEKRNTEILTIRKQVYNGYAKLGVKSKGDFVILATQKELFK